MKKLTEDWKIKKANLRNRSFYDSIDGGLSNLTKDEYDSRKNQSNCLQRKQSLDKSQFPNLNISPVVSYNENICTPLRRSCRLKEKSNCIKLVDKRTKYNQGDASFLFSESFGLKMANEANRFEKSYPTNNSDSPDVHLIKKQPESVDTIDSTETKHENLKQKHEICFAKNIKNKTVKENSSLSFSSNKINQKIKICGNEMKHENSLDVHCKENPNINKNYIKCHSSQKKTTERVYNNQESDNSCGNKDNSAEEREDCYDLAYWGLPDQVISAYKARNINKMFQWQYECLSMKNVLNGKNLVYSAPTSAGKTLVAEILMLKKVIESKKKAMMILPFVSVVREKVSYFQEMFQDTGVVVDGYMGTHRPPGGFKATDIAICTIEKANNLVNRLMEEKRLEELGILVVDELHMLGDYSRGYLLELLLTKLLYNCKKNDIDIQIIGMSATLPNLSVLSFWLHAELYHTDFRPVPLHEMYKVGSVIYDSKTNKSLKVLGRDGVTFANDSDHTIYLTIETVSCGNGVLIFCPSKNWCESLATNIAREIYNAGRPTEKEHRNPKYNFIGQKLREYINGSLLSDILLQLKHSPAGLDAVLKLTVPFGVAFHHAGLTFDERDIIEGAFKQGILKVLVATTTLSSGVNLPARRVLIRSPLFCGSVIDTLSYKQMVGRAGRKGIDNQGESILLCKESERKSALSLVSSELKPVKSCLMKSGKDGLHSSLKRAIIEVIASGAATTHEEVIKYSSCTLLFASLIHDSSKGELSNSDVEASINKCLDYLLDNDFIFKIEKKEDAFIHISYKPSQLGVAILASGFSPEDSLRVLKELQLARRCFVLENDLHILYEVTPPYLSDQMGSLNWMNFLTIWEQLSDDYRRVGELVGVRESFIGLGIQGKIKMSSAQSYHKLAVHQRFYAALALNELIQEVPLAVVSEKYNCNKGILQSLQQTTSTFSGMLTIFCNRLGWYNLELLFSLFQKRVHFGIQQELCDLIQLSTLNAQRARVLYNAGYETISSVASADPDELELVLCNAGSFESEKQLDGDIAKEAVRRREVKRIRITGKQGVNEKEAAVLIIKEAQNFIKHELGIKTIAWQLPEQKASFRLHGSENKQEINNSINGTSAESSHSLPLNSKNISEIYQNSSNKENEDEKINLSVEGVAENAVMFTRESDYKLNNIDLPEISKISNEDKQDMIFLDTNGKDKGQVLTDKDSELNNSNSSQNIKSANIGKSKYIVKASQNKTNMSLKKEKEHTHLNLVAFGTGSIPQENMSKLNGSVERLDKNSKEKSSIYNDKERLNSKDVPLKINLVKSICNKIEKDLCTEDVNNLFDELEKTFLELENEKLLINHGESLAQGNNLTFSQSLLSQSAEVDNVYFAQSFMNFENFSFFDCLEDELDDNIPHNNSKIEEIQCQFTGKKTSDILDTIFDSPVSDAITSVKEKGIIMNHEIDPLQLPNSTALFDAPSNNSLSQKKNGITHNDQINFHEDCSLELCNITNKNLKTNKQDHNEFRGKKSNDNWLQSGLNIISINENLASQSTPKDESKCLKNLDSPSKTCSVSVENLNFSKFNFTEININNIRCSKDSVSDKQETSGDLFESDESLDDDMLSKAQEKKLTPEKNIQSISSCSDEIFNSDNSFEKMLKNPCIPSLSTKTINDIDGEENCFPLLDINTHKLEEHDKVKINLNSENPRLTSKAAQYSPNTVKQISLENSGDIFEDSFEFEQIFTDPKQQLSFEFEDNSEIFKSWNPSPSKIIHCPSRINNEVQKQTIAHEDNKQYHLNNDSFLINTTDFSNFSINCMENTPPKKVSLLASVSKIINSFDPQAVRDKTRDKSFLKIKEINSNSLTSSTSRLNLEKSSPNLMDFNIVNVLDQDFCKFLKCLEEVPMFGLSVACEKVEDKKVVNIGPPTLRAKKCPTTAEKIYVNGDILITGLSFCWSEKAFHIKFPTESNDDIDNCLLTDLENKLKTLQKLFQGFTSKRIVVYDIKSYYKMLYKGCNVVLSQRKDISYLDPSIAAWLLDPRKGQQTVQELVLNYFPEASHMLEGFDRGKGLGLQYWSSVPGRQRAATEAYISFHLIEILLRHLKDKQLYKSFVDVEMPSILTLAKMEQNGLGFNLKLAMDYRKELQIKQEDLLKKAQKMAGRSFNIMSSRDLSRILYKELKLNPVDANHSPMANKYLSLGIDSHSSSKKLPPELKTNKECLEKVMHLHPLPKVIVDWRKLSFAISKVLMPLLRENKFDEEFQMYRMHSTCYVYTMTGRINMYKPNLQFVPRDFNVNDKTYDSNSEEYESEEYGRIDNEISQYGVSLRNIFIPSEGNILLSADYSQLELRILSHLSGDVKLLKSLNSGDDIFKLIAGSWKNTPISSVTDDIRQQAKKICYGIIYGMSSKTLSHQLKTSETEASYFMETFKKSYPGMTNYLNSILENCQRKGYVTTIMERRRYLPHILSENKGERAQAERQAINTTVQGSAADIIKKAMIEIEKQLKHLFDEDISSCIAAFKNGVKNSRKHCRGGFLVLQLHDELIYEVCERDLETVKNIVKNVMEKSTTLSVILPVNVKVGSSWGSMREVS